MMTSFAVSTHTVARLPARLTPLHRNSNGQTPQTIEALAVLLRQASIALAILGVHKLAS
jgi:hypothetical protein